MLKLRRRSRPTVNPGLSRQLVRRVLQVDADLRAKHLEAWLPGRPALQNEVLEIASRVTELFLTAPSDPAQLVAYLEEQCNQDPVVVRDELVYRLRRREPKQYPASAYHREEKLDQGSFGTVWRARNAETGVECALKLFPQLPSLGIGIVVDEAEAQARLSNKDKPHPNIVAVHGYGWLERTPFIAMELVRGGSLKARLSQGRMALAESARLVRDLARAAGYAHEQGIVHRDVKPGNVLLTPEGIGKLTDFGLAQEIVPEVGAILPTETGHIRGTLPYLAPEQVPGSLVEIGRATDVHGLGLLLYSCMTGQAPFDSNQGPQVYRQIAREYPLPHASLAGMPLLQTDPNAARVRDLETIYLQAVRKRPADRYPTAYALAEDLDNWLNERPIRARRPGLRDWSRRYPRRARSAVFSFLLLALVFAGAAWIVRGIATEKQQRANQATAIDGALRVVYEAIREDRFPAAEASLQQATGRLGDNAEEGLRTQVLLAERHLNAAIELDALRQERAVLSEVPKPSVSLVLRKYQSLFASLGCDPSEERAVERIANSPISRTLLLALDDWGTHEPDQSLRRRLWQVAREADPDPGWSDHFRDPTVRENPARLAALAAAVPPERLSIAQLTALVDTLPWDDPTALRLLRSAEERYSQDFWVNFALGRALDSRGIPGFAPNRDRRREALAYFRAALTARPESLAAMVLTCKQYLRDGDAPGVERMVGRIERLQRESWLKNVFLARVAQKRMKEAQALAHLEAAQKSRRLWVRLTFCSSRGTWPRRKSSPGKLWRKCRRTSRPWTSWPALCFAAADCSTRNESTNESTRRSRSGPMGRCVWGLFACCAARSNWPPRR